MILTHQMSFDRSNSGFIWIVQRYLFLFFCVASLSRRMNLLNTPCGGVEPTKRGFRERVNAHDKFQSLILDNSSKMLMFLNCSTFLSLPYIGMHTNEEGSRIYTKISTKQSHPVSKALFHSRNSFPTKVHKNTQPSLLYNPTSYYPGAKHRIKTELIPLSGVVFHGFNTRGVILGPGFFFTHAVAHPHRRDPFLTCEYHTIRKTKAKK